MCTHYADAGGALGWRAVCKLTVPLVRGSQALLVLEVNDSSLWGGADGAYDGVCDDGLQAGA